MTSEERFNRIENVLDRVVDPQLQINTTVLTLYLNTIRPQ
jgi:hypothetical protein